MNGRINQSLGTGHYHGFSWPPQDESGQIMPQVTIHTWQCISCGQVAGIGTTSQGDSISALLSHRCPEHNSNTSSQLHQLAAD